MGFARTQRASIFARRPTPSAVRLGIPFVRVLMLGVAAIIAAIIGLTRAAHYKPKPMFVPAPEVLTEIEVEP